MIKNIESLREFLAEQLERTANNEITAAAANAQANIAGKIISSVKIQLEHNKTTGTKKRIPFLG
jgi:hypothetical protein